MRDISDDYALLAVQGPRSLERLGLDEAPPFTFAMDELDGIEVMVNRTGYTGETGVELMVPAEEGKALWDAVLARGVTPAGLGARDTLRLEVCYPLHGNDIGPDTDAISAGLGWVCALDKDFTGADELGRIKAEGPSRKLGAFVMEDAGIPRQGMAIDGRRRGHLRNALPDARPRHRHGLCPHRAGRARHRAHDRRAREASGAPASSRNRSTSARRIDGGC